MQVNAVISAIVTAPPNTGKKINTTVTYLRESQESKAMQLGTALNALTTNTLDSVKVNEINIDPDAPSREPNLTLKRSSNSEKIYIIYTNNESPTVKGLVWNTGGSIVEQTIIDPESGAPAGTKKQINLNNVSTSYSTLTILITLSETTNFDSASEYTVIGNIPSV